MRAAVREAVGGQIAISNVAPRHVPVNAAGMVGEVREAVGGQIAISKVAPNRLLWAGGASGGWAGRYTKSCPKSSP